MMFRSLGLFRPIQQITNKMFCQFGIIKFKLPDLGEKIKEGTIKKLYVQEGD